MSAINSSCMSLPISDMHHGQRATKKSDLIMLRKQKQTMMSIMHTISIHMADHSSGLLMAKTLDTFSKVSA